MTADLSREEIERLDRDLLDRISRGIYGDAPAPIDVRMWLRVVKHLLSEPTRLAAARAEGYREGVEAAAQELSQKAAAAEERAGRSSKQDRVLARYAADLYGRAASGLRALLQGGSDAG